MQNHDAAQKRFVEVIDRVSCKLNEVNKQIQRLALEIAEEARQRAERARRPTLARWLFFHHFLVEYQVAAGIILGCSWTPSFATSRSGACQSTPDPSQPSEEHRGLVT
jgi:hypothetical protein